MVVRSGLVMTPPLKAAIRLIDFQRIDEHGHAAGRASAGDCEFYSGVAQAEDGLNGALGEDFFLGDQRAVHVGDDQANLL